MRVPLASFAVAAALFAAAPASAATINVTVPGDGADPNPGDGTCDNGSGACTLRAAVQTANASAGADTVVLQPGTFTRSLNTTNEDAAAQGDLDITSQVTIDGAGVNSTFIDAGGHDRVLDVRSGGQLILSNLVVENGAIDSFVGGGIQNSATLVLDHVVVTNNTSSGSTAGGSGGGVYNSGTFTASDSSITSNHATGAAPSGGYGGGIYNGGGMSINRVLVANNSAARTGGGLTQAAAGAGIITSTFSGNTAVSGGGAMSTFSSSGSYTATITWSTIVGNSTTTSGAGALSRSDLNNTPWSIGSSIVAGNSSADGSPQCATSAQVTSDGHNVVGDGSCGTAATGDQKNTDPAVGPLQDNGGPTLTRLPNPGGPAIDNGDTADCPLVDQRGIGRPIGSACDVGAVEAAPVVPPPPSQPSPNKVVVDPVSATRTPGDANSVTATVTRTDGSPAANIQLRFVIAGPNPGSGVLTTDSSGKVAIAWNGVHDGTDTLTAFVDVNGNSTPDGPDIGAQASVNWVLPTPVIAKTVNLEPVSGKVLVKLPSTATGKVSAAASYIPLQEAKSVPIGTIVDARKGHVELNSAIKKGSKRTQTGEFYSGAFQMGQTSGSPYMEVTMSEGLICPKPGKSKVTAARATSRHLWGKDKGGKFRTRGRHSTATVRGTTWYTKDTCTTTTTVVRAGSVIVKDLVKHKNVTVKAGKRYVARAKKGG